MERTNYDELPSHRGADEQGSSSSKWAVLATLVFGTLAVAGLRPTQQASVVQLDASSQSSGLSFSSSLDTSPQEAPSVRGCC